MLSMRRRKSQAPEYNNPAFIDDLDMTTEVTSLSNGHMQPPPPYDGCPKSRAVKESVPLEPPADYQDDGEPQPVANGHSNHVPVEVNTQSDDNTTQSDDITTPNSDVTVEISQGSGTDFLDSSFDDSEELPDFDEREDVTVKHMDPESQLLKSGSVALLYDETDGVSKAIIEIHSSNSNDCSV